MEMARRSRSCAGPLANHSPMGAAPRFTAIRLFVNPDGWVAAFTGSDIAERFPRLEPATA